MAKLEFRTLRFREKDDFISASFMNIFRFRMEKDDLLKIGKFKIGAGSIEFEGVPEKTAQPAFNSILAKGFADLENSITGNKAVYVHRNSGIPLIGNISFGIVDRGTSLIEIKPITSCNLDCIFCSVYQGNRPVDFVVEREYLADEFRKLVECKGSDAIEAHINAQGEPALYSEIIGLVKDISSIKQVRIISMDTNGTLLSKKAIDSLAGAGLARFNLSLNAMEQDLAQKIAGKPYSLKHVLEMAEYAAKKCGLMITPVWMHGINDTEIPKIIEFAKNISDDVTLGIQNFLSYKHGRSPVKPASWKKFYSMLKGLEARYSEKLLLDKDSFGIAALKPLPKPFRKGNVIKAEIACDGRMQDEKIAVACGRTISVRKCGIPAGKTARIRITGDKHNIFYAELV